MWLPLSGQGKKFKAVSIRRKFESIHFNLIEVRRGFFSCLLGRRWWTTKENPLPSLHYTLCCIHCWLNIVSWIGRLFKPPAWFLLLLLFTLPFSTICWHGMEQRVAVERWYKRLSTPTVYTIIKYERKTIRAAFSRVCLLLDTHTQGRRDLHPTRWCARIRKKVTNKKKGKKINKFSAFNPLSHAEIGWKSFSLSPKKK